MWIVGSNHNLGTFPLTGGAVTHTTTTLGTGPQCINRDLQRRQQLPWLERNLSGFRRRSGLLVLYLWNHLPDRGPGVATSFTFALSPMSKAYPAAVSFNVGGLPAGATYTMTPSTIPSTGGA